MTSHVRAGGQMLGLPQRIPSASRRPQHSGRCPLNLHINQRSGTPSRLNRQAQCKSASSSAGGSSSFRSTQSLDNGNGKPPEGGLPLQLPRHLDTPEELEPLKEALHRAHRRVQSSAQIREDLEGEAQKVAQLAINAREAHVKARARVDQAVADMESAEIVKQKLLKDLQELQGQQEKLQLEDAKDLAVLWAEQKASTEDPAKTLDLTGLAALQVEVSSKEKASAQDLAQTVDLAASEGEDLAAMLAKKEQDLQRVVATLQELSVKCEALEERAQAADNSANSAEEVASAAMRSAESAVREEMEASAVAKETQSALSKALAELTFLETSFEESDFETSQQRKQARKEAQKQAEVAVQDALDAVGAAAQKAEASDVSQGLVEVKADKQRAEQLAEQAAEKWSAQPPAPEPAPRTPKQEAAALRQRQIWMYASAAVVMAGLATTLGASAGLRHSLYQAMADLGTQIWKVPTLLGALLQKLPLPEIPHGEQGLIETIWLLLTSVVSVPLISKLPGGSPVLGFLAGGALIGPHALGVIKDVEAVRHIAELGVVFLLFNIGLELSLERLQSMQKYVFGLGTSQVVVTLAVAAYSSMLILGLPGPGAIILGGGLALSSTAVAMQVLQDRGESGSRHGRATFAVLLLQDLAVVVLLMLVPLLAPSESGALGLGKIAKALGVAGLKAVICIVSIIAGGRVLLRPFYRRISAMKNNDIFAATTLLVVLGTSVMTQLAGLSLALGAFLAGLLVAETEFAMQVESDIAPYKGLLMGLFFMTVGMEISVGLFFAEWKAIISGIVLLIVGKTAVMTALGHAFGLSHLQAARAGLLLAAGGEFAFVTFGEAVQHKILPAALVSKLFLVVALSMALTPFLAEGGAKLGKVFEKSDMKALQPNENLHDEVRDHVIIAGFGRVGQIIGQLLSERLIPFVALDVQSDRVQAGKELDLPVYFGDAGSPAVLHAVGAARAACAVITLDTPGANYRTVWALHKHFPNIRIYVRAHDVTHGITLEKAGATAVVPETLEPSLQLASAVLSELKMPQEEVAQAIQTFRKTHISDLQVLCRSSGSSLGYGFATLMDEESSSDEEDEVLPGKVALAEA